MHEIEPYYNWRDYYVASEDKLSPFYRRRYSELYYTNRIYNYYIHPQWDFFGSSTLYCKILFADYESGYAIIELLGEWNDAVHNDIMEMKRGLIDPLIKSGISRFILIGENVLNFHASDDLYYEEWYEDIKDNDGWIVALNFREHLVDEMKRGRLDYYVNLGEGFNGLLWRKLKPANMVDVIEALMMKRLQ
ncbi:MAG TPA: hypothetical protein VG603_07840 [Chitinophagales bacterium]|nr:hypothetical protein [Chitinophagales bacterium]